MKDAQMISIPFARRTPMKTLGAVCLIAGLLIGGAANAIDINGVWANDLSVCNKVFEKKNNAISMTRDSDNYGSGFIISGNQIKGKIVTCTIKSRKEDGALVHLIASCSTDVALSTVQFSLRSDDENRLTRVYPGVPEMAVPYVRCPM
jgi:hypothetical protein